MKRPKDQRVVEGNAAFFSCDVTSEPPLPHIHWTKDGQHSLLYLIHCKIVTAYSLHNYVALCRRMYLVIYVKNCSVYIGYSVRVTSWL